MDQSTHSLNIKSICIAILFCILANTVLSQEPIVSEEQNVGKVKIIPLPVLGANPTFGWIFGVAPAASWYMGKPENTTLSSALAAAMYTTNQQLMLSVRGKTFFKSDAWNMLTVR